MWASATQTETKGLADMSTDGLSILLARVVAPAGDRSEGFILKSRVRRRFDSGVLHIPLFGDNEYDCHRTFDPSLFEIPGGVWVATHPSDRRAIEVAHAENREFLHPLAASQERPSSERPNAPDIQAQVEVRQRKGLGLGF